MKDSSFDDYVKINSLMPEIELQLREERTSQVRSIISDFVSSSLENSKILIDAGIKIEILDGVTVLKSNDGTVLLNQNDFSLRIIDDDVKWRSYEIDALLDDDYENEIFHLRANKQLFELLKTKKMLKS
jgi:hypothetical protein